MARLYSVLYRRSGASNKANVEDGIAAGRAAQPSRRSPAPAKKVHAQRDDSGNDFIIAIFIEKLKRMTLQAAKSREKRKKTNKQSLFSVKVVLPQRRSTIENRQLEIVVTRDTINQSTRVSGGAFRTHTRRLRAWPGKEGCSILGA